MTISKDAAPINIRVAQRKNLAFKLRTAGLSYREIAAEVIARFQDTLPTTYDQRYAHRDVKWEMDRLREATLETAQDYRMLEMERLDTLQTAVYDRAISGDYKAITMVLKIMHHRALLLGLYAPSKSKLEVSDWHTEVIDLIKSGRITRAQAEEELGEETVRELLESGGKDIVEGIFAEEEDRE